MLRKWRESDYSLHLAVFQAEQPRYEFGILIFGHCNLFVICDLLIGILQLQTPDISVS
jgi:hypothetical protein